MKPRSYANKGECSKAKESTYQKDKNTFRNFFSHRQAHTTKLYYPFNGYCFMCNNFGQLESTK